MRPEDRAKRAAYAERQQRRENWETRPLGTAQCAKVDPRNGERCNVTAVEGSQWCRDHGRVMQLGMGTGETGW